MHIPSRKSRPSAVGDTTQRLPRSSDSDVEVVELSREQYEQAVATELHDLGLTYQQLARQARTDRFASLRARKLWLAIGEHGSAR